MSPYQKSRGFKPRDRALTEHSFFRNDYSWSALEALSSGEVFTLPVATIYSVPGLVFFFIIKFPWYVFKSQISSTISNSKILTRAQLNKKSKYWSKDHKPPNLCLWLVSRNWAGLIMKAETGVRIENTTQPYCRSM